MTTLCIVTGTSPLLTGMFGTLRTRCAGELRSSDCILVSVNPLASHGGLCESLLEEVQADGSPE